MASTTDLLRPITYTKTVSRVSGASSWLLNWMGMQAGGPNEAHMGHGREGSYHVFNNLRSTGLETAPGMPAARRPRQPVGRVPFVYPRMHEEFSLPYEEIHNFAKIDNPGVRDSAGEDYIRKQSLGPGQRHGNWRASLLVGMLRDSLYLQEFGNYWYTSYSSSGAIVQRSFQLPAGNKDQCNITDLAGNSIYGGNIIDASWDNPGADIPLHIQRICAAILRRHGIVVRNVLIRSDLWQMIIKNENVAVIAGSSNQSFKTFEKQVGTNPDGTPMVVMVGQLAAVPGITFFINDDGRELGYPGSESWNYDIEDGKALFLPDPNPDLFQMLTGSEPIVAPYTNTAEVKIGFAAWTKLTDNPSAYQAFTLDNALAVPYVPGCWAYADCLF